MSLFNQFTKTRFYLRQGDSQRSDNDFRTVHVCDSRRPQLATLRTAGLCVSVRSERADWAGVGFKHEVSILPQAGPRPFGWVTRRAGASTLIPGPTCAGSPTAPPGKKPPGAIGQGSGLAVSLDGRR